MPNAAASVLLCDSNTMQIAFFNQKGGVGKTTLALLLAAILEKAGYDVAVEDRDPQHSATFLARSVFKLPLLSDKPSAGCVIVDTPGYMRTDGRIEGDLSALMRKVDKAVLVAEKSLVSVHASLPMARLIREQLSPGARAYVLFNKVRQATLVGRQEDADVARDLALPLLRNTLPLAAAFENAQMLGLAAVTGANRDRLLNLALEIMK